jgi:hypothetical protein
LHLLKQDFNSLFTQMDLNNDGRIDASELVSYVKSEYTATPDTRVQYNKQLAEQRKKSIEKNKNQEKKAVYLARSQRMELMENAAAAATVQQSSNSDILSKKKSSEALARMKVKDFLRNRNLRYQAADFEEQRRIEIKKEKEKQCKQAGLPPPFKQDELSPETAKLAMDAPGLKARSRGRTSPPPTRDRDPLRCAGQ